MTRQRVQLKSSQSPIIAIVRNTQNPICWAHNMNQCVIVDQQNPHTICYHVVLYLFTLVCVWFLVTMKYNSENIERYVSSALMSMYVDMWKFFKKHYSYYTVSQKSYCCISSTINNIEP